MNVKLRNYSRIMTKLAIPALVICQSLIMAFASDLDAQRKYLNEIEIDLPKYSEVDLKELIISIEQRSDFEFVFPRSIVRDKTIRLASGTLDMESLLKEISIQAHVSIKRINETISFSEIEPDASPSLIEETLVQISISGQITDQAGEPLPGATVQEKGTTNGTITDIEGNYSLSLPEDATLVVSFVGFSSQEFAVNGMSVIDVSLSEDVASLEEVIVVGYGTAKKSDLTGAVNRLDATQMEKQGTTNLLELLNGTVAGFNSTQGANAAGGGSLEIRGANSLTASTEPLVVLDGVIFNGDIANINPTDIETIDILKDASAAAVFGSRAASGVIIITTKKGSGKPTVNFSTKIGIAEISNDIRPYDAQGYLDFRRDHSRAIDPAAQEFFYFNPDELPASVSIDEWRNYSSNPNADNTQEWLNRLNFFPEEIENYTNGNTVDWYDLSTRNGLRQSYDLSISGQKENTSYFMSVGYTDNEGVLMGDDFKTVRTRLNLDSKVTEWLNVGMNTQFSVLDNTSVPADFDGQDGIFRISPYGSDRDEDGNFVLVPHGYVLAFHPLGDFYDKQEQNVQNNLFGVIYANVQLPFGFNYRISFQNRYEFSRDYNFWPSTTSRGGLNNNTGGLGFGDREDETLHEWMVDNILSWKKSFGKHEFDATFLFNLEELNRNTSIQSGSGFAPNENLGFNGLQFSEFQTIENDDLTRTADALMARINYRLNNKYMFTASIRRDGFSAFGQSNPRATFPALALGWVLSEETFFPQSDVISNLKLRLSWGENGNRSVGTYTALARLQQELYLTGSSIAQGVNFASLANPNLRWEQTESYNLGIDFGLIGNRINGSLELYQANTTDLLVERQLPSITGFGNIISNIGRVENSGFELTINTINVDNPNIKWRSGLIMSLNRNEITELFGDTETVNINGEDVTRPVADIENGWFPGEAIDRIWDYDVSGVWQLGEEDAASAYGQRPGDFRSVDVNNDSLFTQLEDKQFIGYEDPRFRIGIRNEVTFLKNFSLSVFLRGEFGHMGRFNQLLHNGTNVYDRVNTYDLPYWSTENPTNDYGSLAQSAGAYEGGLNIWRDRSYLRVQDVTLSYNIPKSALERVGGTSATVFASVRNLYTFTSWEDWDPETGDNTDNGNLPMPRIYTFGFNISL